MEEKNCKNCRYFLQHYVKHKRYILKVECGHCLKRYRLKCGECRKNCESWEPIAIQKEERRKSIKALLRDMEKSLEDIKLILQSDED